MQQKNFPGLCDLLNKSRKKRDVNVSRWNEMHMSKTHSELTNPYRSSACGPHCVIKIKLSIAREVRMKSDVEEAEFIEAS